jgi:hypothetical protein
MEDKYSVIYLYEVSKLMKIESTYDIIEFGIAIEPIIARNQSSEQFAFLPNR